MEQCTSVGQTCENNNQLLLVDLPTDVLLCIFKFCNSASLRNLSVTCKRLNDVTSEDFVWLKRSKNCLITNQQSSEILLRSGLSLRAKEKCRISANWRSGYYNEKFYNTSNIKYMPWLQLERDVLWISRGSSIAAFRRHTDGLHMQPPLTVIKTSHTEDISRFVKTDDIIYTGGKDKYICVWSTSLNELVLYQHSNHIQDIQGLDSKRNILVSGSKDGTIKVWQVGEECSSLECTQTVSVSDRVWCVTLDPSLSYVAAGSAGYSGVHPLHLYDLSRGLKMSLEMERRMLKKGAAVFDIKWECPNTLATCGYDTITRLWDLRVGRCVSSCWVDPFGAPGYCLASDLQFSLVCGTAHHARAQLWDKRSSTSVQAYFGRRNPRDRSPVYSVSFDPCHLFLAQDSCLNVLDFSTHFKPEFLRADYSSYW